MATREALARMTLKQRAAHNAYRRAHYAAHRDELNAKQRAYRETHSEEVNAKERAHYVSKREEILARNRARYAAKRDKILAQKRAYYEARREELRTKARLSAAARRTARRALINSLKTPCANCGTTEGPINFDHIDPTTKLSSVGSMTNRAEAAIQAEIAKCACLCGPCHRKRGQNAQPAHDV
jgi:hypothetical protein